ncbi:MAG: DUF134 domain-containing protein [Campylobacterota bacterium]|nr:DUF134 domain-containing protein [Campylobacterota bacterium]
MDICSYTKEFTIQAGRRIRRTIAKDHTQVCFKPCGIRRDKLEKMIIDEDEMEAIRLSDFEGLYQQECADKMDISRTTFSRLIENARRKISDALLNNKAISIRKQYELKDIK